MWTLGISKFGMPRLIGSMPFISGSLPGVSLQKLQQKPTIQTHENSSPLPGRFPRIGLTWWCDLSAGKVNANLAMVGMEPLSPAVHVDYGGFKRSFSDLFCFLLLICCFFIIILLCWWTNITDWENSGHTIHKMFPYISTVFVAWFITILSM